MAYEPDPEAEGQRAIEWLGKHWTGPKQCPICGSSGWNVNGVSEIRNFSGGNLVLGGPNAGVTPVVPVMCGTCGYTFLINALVSGAIKPQHEYDEGAPS